MSVVATFKPASKSARRITVGDMDLALAKLPEGWEAEREGDGEWQVTLRRFDVIRGERVVTHEMAMWSSDGGVDIGGFDVDVIDAIGQFLADRAGPQVFEDDAGSDAIPYSPRKGAKRQPAPKPPAPNKPPKRQKQLARIVPLDVLVDDLDPLARAAWHHALDLPPSRRVIADDLAAVVRTQRQCTLKATGTGAKWRATIERTGRPAIALSIDAATEYLTIEAELEDEFVVALGHGLAAVAGAQGLVVGDEAVSVFVPERR